MAYGRRRSTQDRKKNLKQKLGFKIKKDSIVDKLNFENQEHMALGIFLVGNDKRVF